MGIFVYVYKNEKDKSLELVNFVCLTVRATYLDPLLLEFSMFLSFGHTSFEIEKLFMQFFKRTFVKIGLPSEVLKKIVHQIFHIDRCSLL